MVNDYRVNVEVKSQIEGYWKKIDEFHGKPDEIAYILHQKYGDKNDFFDKMFQALEITVEEMEKILSKK